MTLRPLPFALAALVFLASCENGVGANGDESEVPGAVRVREATRVRVALAERREMVATLETTTNLESERRVAVVPKVSGEVTEVLAEEGDAVEAGQVLAKLDARDEEVALLEAEVALQEAEQAVERSQVAIREAEARIEGSRLAYENANSTYARNEGQGLISTQDLEGLRLDRDTTESEWDQAKLALETARIDARTAETSRVKAQYAVDRAELARSYTELRAPFAATVAERNVRLGERVSTTSETFTLIDLGDLRAEFYRPQRELALFSGRRGGDAVGTPPDLDVTLTAEALPGHTFDATILRVSPDVDPESGSFRVTVDVEPVQDGARLLPGMLVRLEIVTERHPDALVVSKRALRREGETSVVFVVREDTAHRVVVDEAFSDDASVEVVPRQGYTLDAGEPVVVVGNRDLEEGDPVRVANAEEIGLADEDEAAEEPEAAADDDSDESDEDAGGPSDAPGDEDPSASGPEAPGDASDTDADAEADGAAEAEAKETDPAPADETRDDGRDA